jgi:TRAP transporter TAXI family solute receptor
MEEQREEEQTMSAKLTRRACLTAAGGLAGAFLGLRPARAQQFITILTGGTGGVYYPLGVALSEVFAEAVPEAQVSVQSTKASVENLNLLQAGRGEIAFTLGDSLADAWEGMEEAGFPKKLDKLRGIAAIYPNFIQIVASRESGIKTLEDLKGKRLSVGAPRSGTELNARTILSAAGISYDDLGKVEYLPFSESVELMKNRQLDATLQSAGLGVASIRDLSSSIAITMVEIPASLVEGIGPPYVAETIPAGTYTGQDADVPTAAVRNYLVSTTDVDDQIGYAMTSSLFENLDHLVAAHQAAKGITLENATSGMPVPLHPGAERYYQEKGVI